MFPEMRRSKQQLSDQESLSILQRGTSGVLALAGEDGWPYAVPLSYGTGRARSGSTAPPSATSWTRFTTMTRAPSASLTRTG